jgi:hypothetical protein
MSTNIIKSNEASRLKTKFSFNNKISKQDFEGNWIIKHSIHSPFKKNQCCGYLVQTSKFHEIHLIFHVSLLETFMEFHEKYEKNSSMILK